MKIKGSAQVQIKNMTGGSPAKLIISFAFPLMLGNLFQQAYTFVDTLVAGQALGMDVLAALGATEWLIFLVFGFIQGLVQGFSVVISQYFGAKEEENMKRAAGHAVLLSGVGAVALTLLAQAAAAPALALLGTPERIRGYSLIYLRILYGAIPLVFLYHLTAALLRAVGNSRTPLRAMTASSLCNIVLDILFVFGFRWGIQGAAAATVVAQAAAAAVCLVQVLKIPQLRVSGEQWRPDREMAARQLRMGVPMGVQNGITALGGLVVQRVVNGFGVVFLAGFTAANKLYGLLEIAASSYGYAMSSYAGQNRGAGRWDRIGKGLRAANLIGILTACGMSAVMLLFGRWILGGFLTGEAADVSAAMEVGYRFLCVLAVFFPLLYVLYITRACVQGMGNAFWPMVSSIVQLVMRVGCALLLTSLIGEQGVFFGEVMAWAGADLLLYFCYRGCMRKAVRKAV